MTQTKPPRRSKPAPAAVAAPLPTLEQGRALFHQVLLQLQNLGYERHRVDTLRHKEVAPDDRHAMTIRHHYDHGTWELYFEPDKYWNPSATPYRIVRIRTDRPLATAQEIVQELVGP